MVRMPARWRGKAAVTALVALGFLAGTCAAFQAERREQLVVDVERAALFDQPGGCEIGGLHRFVPVAVYERTESHIKTLVAARVDPECLGATARSESTRWLEAAVAKGGADLLRVNPAYCVSRACPERNRKGDIREGTQVRVVGTGTEANVITFSCWIRMRDLVTDSVSPEYVLGKFHFTDMRFEYQDQGSVCRGKVTCLEGPQVPHKLTLSVYSHQA